MKLNWFTSERPFPPIHSLNCIRKPHHHVCSFKSALNVCFLFYGKLLFFAMDDNKIESTINHKRCCFFFFSKQCTIVIFWGKQTFLGNFVINLREKRCQNSTSVRWEIVVKRLYGGRFKGLSAKHKTFWTKRVIQIR